MGKVGSNPQSIKSNNQKLVLNLFRENKILSITEVAKTIKLSKTTVIKIFDYFLNKNIIIYIGKGGSSVSGGKKPELFELNKLYGYVLSIQIISNKLLLSILDTNADIIITKVTPIEENDSIDNVTDIISNFINEITDSSEYKQRYLLGISIAAQGVTDTDKGEILSWSRFPSWEYKTPIIKILKDKTSEDYNYYIDNQIRYISLAEQFKGKAKKIRNFFILHAEDCGVVGSIIINGELFRGNNYLAGEIGHMRIDPYSEEKCHCGGKGCFENIVANEKIIARAKELYSENSVLSDSNSITISKIFKDSNNKNPAAMKVIEEYATWYALGLSNGCMMIDPEMIIIAGGIADAGDYFLNKLREKLSNVSLTQMKKEYNIQYTSFNKNGALIGGAINTINNYFNHFFKDAKNL